MKNPEQTRGSNHTINYAESSRHLCGISERYLITALEKTAYVFVVVDGCSLIIKVVGKLTALSINSNSGFIKGHWYTPITPRLRHSLRKAFDRGIPILPIASGTWDYMRPAHIEWKSQSPILFDEKPITSVSHLLAVVRKLAENLPPKFGDIDYSDDQNQTELMRRDLFRALLQAR